MRFDRQVLYLVFLFGTTHAFPARTTSSVPTTPASLDDDSPNILTLDISSELISSVADFATQVVAAVFSEGSGSSSSSWTTSRNLLDDESSSSSDPTPPRASLQTTRIAATPSDPKSPAVASSTSTPGRSRTGLFSRLSIARTSLSPRPAAHTTSTHARLQHSSLTAEDQDTPLHNATPTHPANAHATGAQKDNNSTISNKPISQGSGVANTMAATTTAPFNGILDIIGQAASSTDSSLDEEPSATNALDVLFSALPSSYATSIQSQFSDLLDPVASDIDRFTSDLFTSAGERTTGTRTDTRPTTRSHTAPTIRPTTTRGRPHTTPPTTRPTTALTSTPSPLPPPPPSDTTDQTPTPTISNGAATTTPAPTAATTHSASNPISKASTIGIATGVASGVVLLCLGGLYLYRRRAAGLAPFNKRSGSKRSNKVYPEVAWLYDPDITPPRSRAGSSAGEGEAEAERLVPAPRPGSVEIGGTAVGRGYDWSPEMRGQGSPLLAPVAARGGRGDLVGSRSRSGSEVDVERLRPLSIVREESPGRSFTRG